MKKFKFTINGNTYDVEIGNIEDNIAEVSVNGTLYKAELDKNIETTKTPKLVRTKVVPSTDSHPSTTKTYSPDAPKGSGTVKSPLPGVILSLHIQQGDKVAVGQKLITLEAMKMENNINSDKDGIVTQINVRKGDNVMEGDTLIIIGD